MVSIAIMLVFLFKQSTRVWPKGYGLPAWRQNCKWYSSLPLGGVVSLSC